MQFASILLFLGVTALAAPAPAPAPVPSLTSAVFSPIIQGDVLACLAADAEANFGAFGCVDDVIVQCGLLDFLVEIQICASGCCGSAAGGIACVC